MSGAVPPLPNTRSWRGAQLKKSTGTTLLLEITSRIIQNYGSLSYVIMCL
jgi:hypothetical protein